MFHTVIFGFNRPAHMKRLLDSLLDNEEASSTPVTIYIDGPRNNEDLSLIQQTIAIANSYNALFQNVKVIARTKNFGSASNIIEGVTEQFKHNEAIIVLEDDIVVSKKFLHYMNLALNKYKNTKNIFHISAYSDFDEFPDEEGEPDDF